MSQQCDRPAGTHVSMFTIAIATLALSGGCASTQHGSLGSVIEATPFSDRLNDTTANQRIIVLDLRGADAYDAGHVAGAVRLDSKLWKDESLAAETGLSHEALWHNRIGSAGVSGRDPVVVYDDGRMTEAARAWFIFQHFGVGEVAVLNGGYPALKPLIDAGRVPVSATPTEATPVAFASSRASSGTIGLVERQRVLRSIDERKAQVFDARTPDEFTGKNLRRNTRGGHLPTAINLPHSELLDEHGRLKSPETLAKILEDAGFKRGQPVITHCDGGGRASLAALAAERAGYGPVLNYYLSFGDWAADASCPVE